MSNDIRERVAQVQEKLPVGNGKLISKARNGKLTSKTRNGKMISKARGSINNIINSAKESRSGIVNQGKNRVEEWQPGQRFAGITGEKENTSPSQSNDLPY